MLKGLLITLAAVILNYLPVWAAEQYDQITGRSQKLQRELESDGGHPRLGGG
jgi:hypothetical protein